MTRKVSVAKTKTTTDTETLYTVPTKNRGLWQLMYVASLTGNNSPSFIWYDESAETSYKIFDGKNLGAGEYLMFADAEVVLEEKDEIRISQTEVNPVTFLSTIELIPITAKQSHT
jgi:hypothetical protein